MRKKWEYMQICKKYVGGEKNIDDARTAIRSVVLDHMSCLGLEGWDIFRYDINHSIRDGWDKGVVRHGKPDFHEFAVEISGFAKREIEEDNDPAS
jgi:hypothetical protein